MTFRQFLEINNPMSVVKPQIQGVTPVGQGQIPGSMFNMGTKTLNPIPASPFASGGKKSRYMKKR